ncbi:UNVERIFIED_CONTAM: hypothetical protein FKN15_049050 [Acipenser sinensis]
MTLVESHNECVREGAPALKTGRKWVAEEAVEDVKAAVRIRDIMGQVKHGRGGFGLSSTPPTWQKSASAQQRKLAVNKVQKQEGEDEVEDKGSFRGQVGRMDEMGEGGTMQERLARSMENGTKQDQLPRRVNI